MYCGYGTHRTPHATGAELLLNQMWQLSRFLDQVRVKIACVTLDHVLPWNLISGWVEDIKES